MIALEAYALDDSPQVLTPAPARREWMDQFKDGHAYRCLPLDIGNTYGWQLLLPEDVAVSWNGGVDRKDLVVESVRPWQAMSNFGHGVVTFDVAYVFRTPLDHHLMISGPSNTFKDGASPMMAIVESDWVPYSFTMNYKLTRPGSIQWHAGEPYAQLCVVPAGLQTSVQPVIRNIGDRPELDAQFRAWRERRSDFWSRLTSRDPEALSAGWQKDYFFGRYADGEKTTAGHMPKLRLREAIDERLQRFGDGDGDSESTP